MIGYEFPAIFKFATGYQWGSQLYYAGFPPPWPGNGTDLGTFQLIAHRSAVRQARRVYTYSIGPSGYAPASYKVITPGVSSRIFQIPSNCIHQAISVYGTTNGSTYHIENIPASSPSQYSSTDVLTVSCEERPVLGNIFERVITEISEDTSPYQFPEVDATLAFQATAADDITQQPDPNSETLWLSSSSGSDTQVATVYGRKGATMIREKVTLTGTTPVSTTHSFQKLYHVHLASAAAGAVAVRGSGVPSSGQIEFTAQPADGDTITVGRTGATVTYRFKTTMAAAFDVQIDPSSYQATAANLAYAINGDGTPGTTGTGSPNYYTGTTPHPNIDATIDGTDSALVHVFDNSAAYSNTLTYTLTQTGSSTLLTPLTGSADGPALTTLSVGAQDAYNNVYLNNPGLVQDTEGITLAAGQIFEAGSIPAASTVGASIEYNLPATVNLVSDWLAVPQLPFSLEMVLLGTPAMVVTYETSATGTEPITTPATPGLTSLPVIGNGKLYTAQCGELDSVHVKFVRVKINNAASNVARAIHIALKYAITI
jgi:hypothetical protein